jgi:hypothetical protein
MLSPLWLPAISLIVFYQIFYNYSRLWWTCTTRLITVFSNFSLYYLLRYFSGSIQSTRKFFQVITYLPLILIYLTQTHQNFPLSALSLTLLTQWRIFDELPLRISILLLYLFFNMFRVRYSSMNEWYSTPLIVSDNTVSVQLRSWPTRSCFHDSDKSKKYSCHNMGYRIDSLCLLLCLKLSNSLPQAVILSYKYCRVARFDWEVLIRYDYSIKLL